jgi:AcrR family transcriptional regulator
METRAGSVKRRVVPRVEQVAHNRRQLLTAAHDVFGELGYAGASLDAIAERAGFTKGAVYSHFRSKSDLFLSLLEERIDRRAAAQRQLAARVAGPADIAALVRQGTSQSRDDPQWRLAVLEFRVVAARDDELNARYAAAHRRALDELAQTLRMFFAALGTEPKLPVDQLAHVAFTLDTGGFLEDTAIPGAVSTDDVATLFSHLAGLPPHPDEITDREVSA